MAVSDLVLGANLGNEFDLGVIEAANIHLKFDGTSVIRNVGTGVISSPADAVAYNVGTQALTFTPGDGTAATVLDLSALANAVDIFVDGGTFNAATSVLTLTDTGGATPDVVVDLSAILTPSTDAGNAYVLGVDGQPFVATVVDTDTLVTSLVLDPVTLIVTLADDNGANPDRTVNLSAVLTPSTDASNSYVLGADGQPFVPTSTAGATTSTDVFGNAVDLLSLV